MNMVFTRNTHPILETADLFKRGVGKLPISYRKKCIPLTDRGERQISLRPERTASVARAYIEHNMHHGIPIQKLFYIGPMFRYERQQAGRYRQHHQFGARSHRNSMRRKS